MKSFILISTLIGISIGMPQYGSGNVPAVIPAKQTRPDRVNRPDFFPVGCRLERKTVHSVVEKEEYDTKCTTKYRYVVSSIYGKILNYSFEMNIEYLKDDKKI